MNNGKNVLDSHNQKRIVDYQLLTVFHGETMEFIEHLIRILLELERSPEKQKAYIAELIRLIHSIKNSLSILGNHDLNDIFYWVEKALIRVEDKDQQLKDEDINLILQFADNLAIYFDNCYNSYVFIKKWSQTLKDINT